MLNRWLSRLVALVLLAGGSVALAQFGGPVQSGMMGPPPGMQIGPGMIPPGVIPPGVMSPGMIPPQGMIMSPPAMPISAQGGPIGTGVGPIPTFPDFGMQNAQASAAFGFADGNWASNDCTAPGGAGCTGAGCTALGCAGGCGAGGCVSSGCQFGGSCCGRSCGQAMGYEWAFFGEFMYLRARDAEVAFAVETNSAVAPPAIPIPTQPLGIVDQDFQPAFRGGVSVSLDYCSSLTAQYTMFESDTFNRVDLITTGNEIQNLLTHPTTAQAAQGGLYSDARYTISYDLIDVDYRKIVSSSCCHQTHLLIGARYGSMEQQLLSNLPILGTETVDTDIDFIGAGVRFGLEHERQLKRGFLAYGKLHGSLLAGEWTADYDQGSNFDASIVDTHWSAGRVTPVVDLEVGVGWTAKSGFWRFNAGYLYSAWFNSVATDDWVDSVRRHNFVDPNSTITFDGLTARVETRF